MSTKGNKKIVLAVDDVSMNLAIFKNILADYFDVRLAKSAEIALFILGSVQVDLILLDIEMPGMSGFELIDVLRQIPQTNSIPIIIVTSHAQANIINKAIFAGVKDYIVKPIVPQILKEKVFNTLNIPKPI